jgi:hypothetical protein
VKSFSDGKIADLSAGQSDIGVSGYLGRQSDRWNEPATDDDQGRFPALLDSSGDFATGKYPIFPRQAARMTESGSARLSRLTQASRDRRRRLTPCG